jgi:hypothetical protein
MTSNMNKAALFNKIKKSRYAYSAYIFARDLWSYAKLSRSGQFSQHGEDLFLAEFFSQTPNGFYVDIGCSHPFRISNTYKLYKRGWNGLAVDAIPHFSWLYRFWRPRDTFLNFGIAATSGQLDYYEMIPSVLSTFSKEYADRLVNEHKAMLSVSYQVKVISPNDLFAQHARNKVIDLLSIDVENLDTEILGAIDFNRFRPKVICIEFNNDRDCLALEQIFESNGYDSSKKIGCNIIATRKF